MKRVFEIIPGALSWSIVLTFVLLSIFDPLASALLLIVYLVYWLCRLLYMSALLLLAYHRVMSKKDINWIELCGGIKGDLRLVDIFHVVLYTTYNDPPQLLKDSLSSLRNVDYPGDKLIVVLAGEEREREVRSKLKKIKEEFDNNFNDIIITIHPDSIKGEISCKGANATFSAKEIKKYLERENIPLENVIISCFDSDTQPHRNYFSCLTYNFIANPKRYRMSFQPFPVYSNNIYQVPAFARVVEMGSTFWQLIEGMRWEKFITFSSHSMSFKTLVDAGYWPVDLISDDSLIFWKCFLKFKGDYRVYPLEVPVYMDIAVGKRLLSTIRAQYLQKRRWAWGVENFVFLGERFLKDRYIPLSTKLRKIFQVLDTHINWATWAIIISYISPFILFWGKIIVKNSLVIFNASYINKIIFNSLIGIIILCIIISREFIPPPPKKSTLFVNFALILQWMLLPFVSAVLGSFPALDAQTRLMLGKAMFFYPTKKYRLKTKGKPLKKT